MSSAKLNVPPGSVPVGVIVTPAGGSSDAIVIAFGPNIKPRGTSNPVVTKSPIKAPEVPSYLIIELVLLLLT